MLAVEVVPPVQPLHSRAVYVAPLSDEYSSEPCHESSVGLVTCTPMSCQW